MKKIIAVTAMAALVVASAMAVEVSANAKVSGKVLNYANDELSMFTLDGQAALYDGGTGASFSVSGEKAGASFRIHLPKDVTAFRTVKDENGVEKMEEGAVASNVPALDGIGIWAKPVDFLKLQLGDWGYGTNKEDITWSRINTISWIGGGLLNVQLAPVAGLTVDVGFCNNFVTANKLDGGLVFQVAYGADFGSAKVLGKIADKAFNVAAEYAGNLGPVYLVANAGTAIADGSLTLIDGSVYAKYAADALAVKGYVYFGTNTKDANTLKVAAKVEYNLGAVGLFAQVSTGDLIEDSFQGVNVNPGVTFAIGESNWKVGASMDINDGAFAVAVPLEVSISL